MLDYVCQHIGADIRCSLIRTFDNSSASGSSLSTSLEKSLSALRTVPSDILAFEYAMEDESHSCCNHRDLRCLTRWRIFLGASADVMRTRCRFRDGGWCLNEVVVVVTVGGASRWK
jgi:hypothetical protein